MVEAAAAEQAILFSNVIRHRATFQTHSRTHTYTITPVQKKTIKLSRMVDGNYDGEAMQMCRYSVEGG